MYRSMMKGLLLCGLGIAPTLAQTPPAGSPSGPAVTVSPGLDALSQAGSIAISPLAQPTISPGALMLLELEGRFSQAVAAEGGKAFAKWFAEDSVTLANGKAAVLGRSAIASQAQWDPKDYQLSWVSEGAQMGPSNDMGFTWGRYEGRSKDKSGEPVVITGRYITVWKKVADGSWKVALDASADGPAGAGSCCSLPKP